MSEIPRRMAELFSYMDETRQRLIETAAAINPTLASIRPRGGSWSIAEILEHLAKVEGGIAQLVERSIEWARTHDIAPSSSDASIMASLDEFRLAQPVTKLTAPDIVTPLQDATAEESLESLSRSRERLKAALIGGADLELTTVKRPHRVLGEIDMFQWALFVAQHEERHRTQIERTIDEVTERAAECAPIV